MPAIAHPYETVPPDFLRPYPVTSGNYQAARRALAIEVAPQNAAIARQHVASVISSWRRHISSARHNATPGARAYSLHRAATSRRAAAEWLRWQRRFEEDAAQ
jgi:hypothetical protein